MSEGIGGVTVALQVSGETRTGETMPGVSVQLRPDPLLINSLHPVSGGCVVWGVVHACQPAGMCSPSPMGFEAPGPVPTGHQRPNRR